MKTPAERNFAKVGTLILGCALVLRCIWQVEGAATLDFDGDGKTDFVVVRNTGGGPNGAITWYIVSMIETGPGSNPNAPQTPTLQVPAVSGGQFQFAFNTQVGTNYVVQNSTSLSQSNWLAVTNIVGTGGTVTNKVLIGTNKAGYFRVLVR